MAYVFAPQRQHSTVNNVGSNALRFISYCLTNGFGIVRVAKEAARPAEHCREGSFNLDLLFNIFPPILKCGECCEVLPLKMFYISFWNMSFARHCRRFTLIIGTM